MSLFLRAVNQAMCTLAQEPNTVFVGQSTRYDGAAIFHSLKGVPIERRVEFPVAENLQLGYCTGLSLRGKLPICIFPRLDFLLLAADQLVNHLDKLPDWGWNPKVILRTRIGDKYPLNAGPQHTQDHSEALSKMLTTVKVIRARTADEVTTAYTQALAAPRSTLVIENPS